jgi:hypothetical protein
MSFHFFTRATVVAAGLFIAISCSKSSPIDDANLIAFNDYESVIGWVADNGTVTREQAHSGRYSVKVDDSHEFGMGFSLPLGKAISRKPNKIRISGWAYMTDAKSTARLGLQLFDPVAGKEAFGDGINFADDIKSPKKWTEISKEIVLPTSTSRTQEIRVFLWRGGASSPAYIDDLRIELVD